jgi:4-hydroxysphinganine ceramide fatty acyl 2-hydroxylase
MTACTMRKFIPYYMTLAHGYASLHHTKLPQYMKDMKKYHLAHHYKNFDLGFGVTCQCS